MNSLVSILIVGSYLGLCLAKPQAYPRPQVSPARPAGGPSQYARILRSDSDIQFDGTFNYVYETEDGISAQASGQLKNPGQKDLEAQVITGSYSYTAPDGTPINAVYTADENGFNVQGAHLPTPPPIPEAIARALEYIRSLPPSARQY